MLPSSHIFFFPHFLPFVWVLPPFPFPFLGWDGWVLGFAFSPLQVFLLGVGYFFPFELSLPDNLGISWICFHLYFFLPSHPLPLGLKKNKPQTTLFSFLFFGVLHAEVCMTHVVEGERKVQGSVCVACLMQCALTL